MTTAPTITVRMAITIATIGRLIKNLDIASISLRIRSANGFGIDLHSLANLLHAFDDHAFARLSPSLTIH